MESINEKETTLDKLYNSISNYIKAKVLDELCVYMHKDSADDVIEAVKNHATSISFETIAELQQIQENMYGSIEIQDYPKVAMAIDNGEPVASMLYNGIILKTTSSNINDDDPAKSAFAELEEILNK